MRFVSDNNLISWLRGGIIIACSLLIAVRAASPVPEAAVLNMASGLNAAGEFNNRLKNDLTWTFGGKSQRGWLIYLPLIQQLLRTDSQPDSPEFIAALARWQSAKQMESTGVLDHSTWMKMVATFQARRLTERTVAAPENLQLVSAAEFFDAERPEPLRYVDRQALAAFHQMLTAARKELKSDSAESARWLKIISAYRSPEYQAELRKRNPQSGRAGLAINSPHFTGRALDLYVGGDPVSTRDENRLIQVSTPIYQWLVKNAGRFGFQPYFYEPWHWEYRPSPLVNP